MAGKLRVVMGQPIDEAFLATSVLGSNTEKNRNDARDICLGLNGPLSAIGLQIEYRKGVGLTMREIGE